MDNTNNNDYASRILQLEGSGQDPNSSAVGGFLSGTWLNLAKKYLPNADTMSDDQILALRSDPVLRAQMATAYGKENASYLQAQGFDPTPTNLRLAHWFGPAGAVKVLSANPDTPVSSLFPENVTAANPILRGKTAQDTVNLTAKQMAGVDPMSSRVYSANEAANAQDYMPWNPQNAQGGGPAVDNLPWGGKVPPNVQQLLAAAGGGGGGAPAVAGSDQAIPPQALAAAKAVAAANGAPITNGGGGTGGTFTPTIADNLNPDAMRELLTSIGNIGLGYNPSKLLASMAAGFLGGKGPAQALSGGFAGIAQSQKDDAAEQGALMRYALYSAPQLVERAQENRTRALGQVMSMRGGGLGAKEAAALVGIPLTDQQAAAIDSAMQKNTPMPAGALKLETTMLDNLGQLRQAQVQLKTIRDQIANGDFNLDPLSTAKYKAELAASNVFGRAPSEAAVKWAAMNATLSAMQNDILRGNKGVQTDQDAQRAMQELIAGSGLNNREQAIRHFDYLGNRYYLGEKKLQYIIDQNRHNVRKEPFDWQNYEKALPASPYAGANTADVGRNLYGPNTTTNSATAPPGNAGPKQAPSAPSAAPSAFMQPGQSMNIGGKTVTLIGVPNQ